MPDPAPTNAADHPTVLRLDPAPSKVFTFLEWMDFPEVRDEATDRLIQPAGPAIHVRYRTTGAEWIFWPISYEEASIVLNPGQRYDFSIGRAFAQVVSPYKSKRMISPGEKHPGGEPRPKSERRWLA